PARRKRSLASAAPATGTSFSSWSTGLGGTSSARFISASASFPCSIPSPTFTIAISFFHNLKNRSRWPNATAIRSRSSFLTSTGLRSTTTPTGTYTGIPCSKRSRASSSATSANPTRWPVLAATSLCCSFPTPATTRRPNSCSASSSAWLSACPKTPSPFRPASRCIPKTGRPPASFSNGPTSRSTRQSKSVTPSAYTAKWPPRWQKGRFPVKASADQRLFPTAHLKPDSRDPREKDIGEKQGDPVPIAAIAQSVRKDQRGGNLKAPPVGKGDDRRRQCLPGAAKAALQDFSGAPKTERKDVDAQKAHGSLDDVLADAKDADDGFRKKVERRRHHGEKGKHYS